MPVTPERHARWWVVGKYALFQLPELLAVAVLVWYARGWLGLSEGGAAGLVALWVAKDVALFPFLRRAYEPTSRGGASALVGALGRVEEALAPARTGWVRVGAELWRAELADGAAPLPAGARVRVEAVRGLTLLVEADEA
jgi:membrane protein implicated in regulation of membrane protease activity